MESIVSYFSQLGIDFYVFLKIAGMIILGSLLLSCISKFIFKKQTLLVSAVSSSIAIIFIYVVMVLILTVTTQLRFLITPLPFASISQESIRFFRFADASYTAIAGELLSMIILAFLVNLIDQWLPKGKNILSFLCFLCASFGAYTRIYLSQHFALDIFAGILIAVFSTLSLYFFLVKKTKDTQFWDWRVQKLRK